MAPSFSRMVATGMAMATWDAVGADTTTAGAEVATAAGAEQPSRQHDRRPPCWRPFSFLRRSGGGRPLAFSSEPVSTSPEPRGDEGRRDVGMAHSDRDNGDPDAGTG